MNVNEKIKQLRKKKKASMKEIATYVGVAVTTYRAWEMGRKISSESLLKIANFYRIPASTLLGEKNDQAETLKRAIYYLEEGIELIKSTLT